ncbi:MAG TPA: hypothetical protein VG097_02640 [Gemmata sp.]|nr:hypothetical protein [Gemmata sp.]
MLPKARAQRSVKRAVLVALGMGLAGLIVGVVVYSRNGGVQNNPKPETPPPSVAIPADQLLGLGYLSDDTNIAFAVQPGPIVAYAERMKKDPRELLIQAGIPAKVYDSFTSLGFTLPQIEHIAGGTSFGDITFTFRLTIVLVLRGPLANEDEFLHKLKARKQAIKERYDVELAGFPGFPVLLARVSPTIWVFGLDNKDFKAVDRGGYGSGGKQLPAGLSQAIAEQVPPTAAAWLATSDEQWSEKPALKLLIGEAMKKKEWLPVLARGRSAIAALSFDEPPRFRLFIKTTDEASGEQLRNYFQKLASSDDTVRLGGGGQLGFYDAPIDPMSGYATIARFLTDAVKP